MHEGNLRKHRMNKFKITISLLLLTVTALALNGQEPVTSVETSSKVVALTFDDGPKPEITKQFLDLFEKEKIKVTFFNIGKNVEAHPEITKTVIEKGHEIGNHSYSHPKLPELKDSLEIMEEIERVQKYFTTEFNYIPTLFRAPYLQYDKRVLNILKKNNLIMISANLFQKDAKPDVSPNPIIKKVLTNVKSGSIILGHEREHTVAAMKTIIPELKKRGFRFVTVSELLSYGK